MFFLEGRNLEGCRPGCKERFGRKDNMEDRGEGQRGEFLASMGDLQFFHLSPQRSPVNS